MVTDVCAQGRKVKANTGGSTGEVAQQKSGRAAVNLLVHNGREGPWRRYPVQPYRPFEAPRVGGRLRPTSPISSADSLCFWDFANSFCRLLGLLGSWDT